MRITVLVENTSARGLPAEHGLSLFVQTRGRSFLFDMGHTDRFAQNAEALGIDLNAADFAVLSHGHYDHGGGMRAFFARNDHAPVYASRHAFEPHFNASDEDIGLDPSLSDCGRIRLVDGETRIAEGLSLFGCPDAPDFDAGGMKALRDGALRPEDFRHEQYLLAEEDGRRILFSGCSHRGILNIMRRFRPDVLVGGFHLFRAPLDGALARIAEELDAYPTDYYTCHCTGTEQYRLMRESMSRLRYIATGETFVV